MHFDTRAIHFAQDSDPTTGAIASPIYQTSTFEQEAPGVNKGFDYSRTSNPTRQTLERVLANLEGVEYGAVFASGIAAENAIFQAHLNPGDHVITPTDVYGGTFRLLFNVYKPKGYHVTRVDLSDEDALIRAIRPETKIIWIETPTNPKLLIFDIEKISAIARAHGILTVVDNTFASPVLQQPFALGADLVLHSVTKYLSGHSDVIQGAVLARDPEVFAPIKYLQNATGATASAFDCWLTLRGLKTLSLRVERHAQNAQKIAESLDGHSAVNKVYYPGLASHPGHDIARRQMSAFGGVLSLELDTDLETTKRFVSTRKYFKLAESLGGVKSLICHPASMTHAAIPREERIASGLADGLIRLSVGIEDARDLLEDIEEGLDEFVIRAKKREFVFSGAE
ncbi:MAG: PLP-dependent aspartate aminotransferase family protein [Planctomycetes bacterium]|nr:PLP-dependent aspartate aminotransferase family protein [Planctomycetota bacterium]